MKILGWFQIICKEFQDPLLIVMLQNLNGKSTNISVL